MLIKRLPLVAIATLLITIQFGCEDNFKNPPPITTDTSSPQNLADWIEQLNAIIRFTNTSGPEASRMYAYASIAYYESYASQLQSVNSLVGKVNGLTVLPEPDENQAYNYGIIADAALFTVVADLLGHNNSAVANILSSTYDDHERSYTSNGVTSSIVNRSREYGQLLGLAILEWSASDGFENIANCSESVPNSPSNWQPTPPSFLDADFVCWGDLRPFSANQTELNSLCFAMEPLAVETSSESTYMMDVVEVEEIGNNLNPGQIEIARFWNEASGSFTISGHYMSILKQLIELNLLNGEKTVSAFAHLGIGIADTYIAAFNAKYTYYRPRPLTVIQGNIDMNWNSELDNPYTPEYPSLRSASAYCASSIFTQYYGSIEVKDNTYDAVLNIDERVFESFTTMAQEASLSRIYAGTNNRTTIEESGSLGSCIAQLSNPLFAE